MKLGFVGCGAVASALAPRLAAAGHPVVAVCSRRRTSAEGLAARIPGCRAAAGPQEVAAAADLVFLTVPDDAIAAVAAGVRWGATAAVHCCGGLPAAVLDAPRAGALHPLQSFPAAGPPPPLAGVPFALEAADPGLRAALAAIAESLGGRPFALEPGQRARYHAAATLACGGVTALLQLAQRLFPGIDFRPLAAAGVANPSPTGPVARGDAGMVRRHLAALAAADPVAADVYRDLARAQGGPAAPEPPGATCTVLRGKIHRATVTQADLDYVGSITLDADLMDAADIAPGEAVHVLDIDNGERLVTYAIEGERGSGVVGINGAAARLVSPGHLVIVISYVQVPVAARREVRARLVLVDAANRPLPAREVAAAGDG